MIRKTNKQTNQGDRIDTEKVDSSKDFLFMFFMFDIRKRNETNINIKFVLLQQYPNPNPLNLF